MSSGCGCISRRNCSKKTGSFKPRGVFNKLLSMDPADLARGLVSLSAGNHAAALACSIRAWPCSKNVISPWSTRSMTWQ